MKFIDVLIKIAKIITMVLIFPFAIVFGFLVMILIFLDNIHINAKKGRENNEIQINTHS